MGTSIVELVYFVTDVGILFHENWFDSCSALHAFGLRLRSTSRKLKGVCKYRLEIELINFSILITFCQKIPLLRIRMIQTDWSSSGILGWSSRGISLHWILCKRRVQIRCCSSRWTCLRLKR